MSQTIYGRNRSEGFGEIARPSIFGSRVCWGSIIAGVVVGLVTHALLNLLGLAIGFSAYSGENPDPSHMTMGAGIWMLVSAVIATFAGGMTASWLANLNLRGEGVLHGILTWGLMMIITLYLLGTGLGNVLGGAFSMANSAITGASQGVASQASEQGGVSAIQQQAQRLQQQAQGGAAQRGQNINTERATDTASKVAWWAFAAALLSLASGAFGGLLGFKRNSYVNDEYNRPATT